MSKRELMMRRDLLIWEIQKMSQGDLLKNIAKGPDGIISRWPTGMPRGTNHPEAALLQRKDVDDAIDRLEEMCRELSVILEMLGEAA